MNYYNEYDKHKAAWLRELIAQDLISKGDVDERSIEDIKPQELKGYKQCHFFAGIGVWSYALRLAGWPDDEPVWTGSCPCQPFSAAGKREGFADERHLWPSWFHLIQFAKRYEVPVFGEQVASPDGITWLDLVQDDLEGISHAVWPFDLPAAGFGAPHIRQRLYWVAFNKLAFASSIRRKRPRSTRYGRNGSENYDSISRLAISDGGNESDRNVQRSGKQRFKQEDGSISLLGEPNKQRSQGQFERRDGRNELVTRPSGLADKEQGPCPVNGFWKSSDWIFCTDYKWRPIRPGSFPLVNGSPARVGRLRGYGDAIVATQAATFIESVIQTFQK